MRRGAATVVVVVLALLASAAGGTAGPASVALVPIGSFGAPSLNTLASHFQRQLGVSVRVLPSLPLPGATYDSARKQYVGGRLLGQLEAAYRGGVVIGVTTQDMYNAPYRYVFSTRDARAAVVSTARMDPGFFGLPADGELFYSRIEKMTTKDIGILALHRRESRNPRSVLYDSILSLDDLDFMTEAFAPHPYRADKRSWLAHAKAACTTGSAQESQLRTIPIRTSDDILTVLGKGIEIEKGVLATFESLKVAQGDRMLVAKLRSTFAGGVSLDEGALASLTAHWDAARFQQWATQSQAVGISLATTSLRLGSRPCAAYFGS